MRPGQQVAVKESVLPFKRFRTPVGRTVDILLGPEMRSTGEVLGLADSFGMAFFKAEEAAKPELPTRGTVLLSVAEKTRPMAEVAREFARMGFTIRATQGTHDYLASHGLATEPIFKLTEGRPNIVDEITNRRIHLVVNTPIGRRGATDDSYIRKAAIKHRVPYITTLAAARAAVKGIAACAAGRGDVKALQAYHAGLRPKG